MTDASLSAALARLDRAVSRLESYRPAPRTAPGLAEAHARLEERHKRLRARVQETIERLDALIADGGAAS